MKNGVLTCFSKMFLYNVSLSFPPKDLFFLFRLFFLWNFQDFFWFILDFSLIFTVFLWFWSELCSVGQSESLYWFSESTLIADRENYSDFIREVFIFPFQPTRFGQSDWLFIQFWLKFVPWFQSFLRIQ